MISTAIAVISLVAAGICVVVAIRAHRYAAQCYHFVSESNKRSVTLKKLARIEAELTDHADGINAIQESMRKLRGRMQARTINDARKKNDAQDLDDEEWKRKTNLAFLKRQAE